MAQAKEVELAFPVGGLIERFAYTDQPPNTTVDALNVRPFSLQEGRERGGVRPGINKAFQEDLGNSILLMNSVTNIGISGGDEIWSDDFSTQSNPFTTPWNAAQWESFGAMPKSTLKDSALSGNGGGSSPADHEIAQRDAFTIDTSNSYIVEMYISPFNGKWCGRHFLYVRMAATADVDVAGVEMILDITGSGTIAWTILSNGVSKSTGSASTNTSPGWFQCKVNTGNTVDLIWRGTTLKSAQSVDAQSGTKVAFGLHADNAQNYGLFTGFNAVCYCDTFRIQQTASAAESKTTLFAIGSTSGTTAAAFVSKQGKMIAVNSTTGTAVHGDVQIFSVEYQQKLYVAVRDGDTSTYTGTPPTGAINPKQYDPVTDVFSDWTASAGTLPEGCESIARYRDRIVLAGGSSPHHWFMSAIGDARDWDTGASGASSAIASTTDPDAGSIGGKISALVPSIHDFLLIATQNELHVMRGDPAYGGQISTLTNRIGILTADSWTFGPSGEVIFMSRDGMYLLAPDARSTPQPISRQLMPRQMKNINPETIQVNVEYDVRDNGVHIVMLIKSSPGAGINFWLDWQNKSYWPYDSVGDFEGITLYNFDDQAAEDVSVLYGCRDGFIRRFDPDADTDDGTQFANHVVIGPIQIGNATRTGMLKKLTAVLSDGSLGADFEVYVGESAEKAFKSTAFTTGTWDRPGLNLPNNVRARGAYAYIKIKKSGNLSWALERLNAEIITTGLNRAAG